MLPVRQAALIATHAMDFAAQTRRVLHEHHLDEASGLYALRSEYLGDPEVSLADLGQLDERIEAHLDGLVIGEDAALAFCEGVAAEDPGNLHTLVRLWCRHDRLDACLKLAATLDAEDAIIWKAFTDAIHWDAPAGWFDDTVLQRHVPNGALEFLWLQSLGYRGLPLGSNALMTFQQGRHVQLGAWTIGRSRTESELGLLSGHIETGLPNVAAAAAISVLRLGTLNVTRRIQGNLEQEPWFVTAAALCGGPSIWPTIEKMLTSNPTADGFTAMGLFGDMRAIPILIEALPNDAHGAAAAAALTLLTGADLAETVAVADLPNDDPEPDPSPPPDADGEIERDPEVAEPPGSPVTKVRLSRDPEQWRAWWSENATRFQPNVRYQLGQPATAQTAARALLNNAFPPSLRLLLGDELCIRHGLHTLHQPDAPIRQQHAALAMIAGATPSAPMGAWSYLGKSVT